MQVTLPVLSVSLLVKLHFSNTPGSYTCICEIGFSAQTGYGKKSDVICTDIDECSRGHECDMNGLCENTKGSYSCSCKIGFTGNGFICIPEITESGEGSGIRLNTRSYF